MTESIKVELPILANCKLLSKYKTIGELKGIFQLKFIKYIFLDPKDGIYKGRNPSDELPLVEDASITVAGDINEIIKFSEEATKPFSEEATTTQILPIIY